MADDRIDLRSDTVTRPTPEMRDAIARAEVGDDVIDVDPTVELLQQRTAEILGKEAAIYVPSGTMSNQIAVRLHCRPGDELLCEAGSHIYNHEQGAYAQLSGVVARTVEGKGGVVRLDQFAGLIRPSDEHHVRTRLVCIENTHNLGAGRVQPFGIVTETCEWARCSGLRTHLDGARLFNAVAATDIPAEHWARQFDTVSVCFSKGLGAPVGSALAGTAELIAEARRHRKLFGGGMRQAGIIAAGALFALEHHRERLREDHANAQLIAAAITESEGLDLDPEQVDTNIVIFRVDPRKGSAAEFVAALAEQGVLMLPFGPHHVRAVTHLDVRESEVLRAAESIKRLAESAA
jgi:threonine aldolase